MSTSISRPTGEAEQSDRLPPEGVTGPGSVTLVGSGPGDPGLLTLKGREALEQAEVVVHDRLIGSGILRYASPNAELIDAGKKGGCHPVPQEEIERILIDRARQGKRVVRLKGGDPFLFGRGGEEMEALMKAGIPCELVPGVTSAIAVPAYAGIPVTHRDHASSLHIVTAHRREDGKPIDYAALARLEGTLVFLMGVSELPEICAGLIAGGMDPNTPAAIVERGTTARQRHVTVSVAHLADRAVKEKIEAPAITVVGSVAALSATLDWRSALPLSGARVLVTRSERKAGRLTTLLRARGAEVLEIPCIRTETLDAPLPPLSGYGQVVFTSPTGVESFFERLRSGRRDVREIGDAAIAAVGPSTREALESRGLKVDLVPPAYNGTSLGEALLAEARRFAGKPLLLLRAERGAPELPRILRDGGVKFDEVHLYRTVPVDGDPAVSEMLRDIDAAAFACASSVRNFTAAYPGIGVRAVCIGEQTEKAAREAGYETTVAKKATLEDLVNAVEEAVSKC